MEQADRNNLRLTATRRTLSDLLTAATQANLAADQRAASRLGHELALLGASVGDLASACLHGPHADAQTAVFVAAFHAWNSTIAGASHSEGDRAAPLDHAVLAAARLGYIERDLATGRLTYTESFRNLLGYSHEETRRLLIHWREYVHPDDISFVTAVEADLLGGEVQHFEIEVRVRTQGGTWICLQARGALGVAGSPSSAQKIQIAVLDVTARRQAEEALRKSQARLEVVLEGANLGFMDQNFVTGEIVFNNRWAEMLGYTRAEFEHLGHDWQAQLHPDDIEQVGARMNASVFGGPDEYESEHRVRTRTGAYRWVLARGRVAERNPDGTARRLTGTRLDITDRKEAEAALRVSEETHRLLVENQAELVVRLDAAGQMVYVSPSYCRTFGKTEAELLTSGYLGLIHPEDLPAALAGLEAARHPPYYCYVEERAQTMEGWRWLGWHTKALRDEAGVVTGFVGVARDIHEQKLAQTELQRYRAQLEELVQQRTRELAEANQRLRAELAERTRTDTRLRESESMFRTLAATLPLLVVIIEGDYAVYVNPATLQLLGYSREEFLRIPIIDHVRPALRQPVADRINHWRTGPGKVDRYELAVVTHTGEERRLDFSAAPIDHHGNPALLGTALDVTEQRQAEAEARRQQAQLAHVARVSTVGEMASGLAHQLAQPLSAVLYNARGALTRLASGPWNPDDARSTLTRIAQQAERAGEFVRSLKSFVRKAQPHLQATALVPVLEEALGFADLAARGERTELRLEINTTLPRVRIDRSLITQVVLNLVHNSIEAMRTTPPPQRCVLVSAAVIHRGVEVTVRDFGSGLSDVVRPHLFQPFFTTRTTGTGLGLSISRTIIEEIHGGHIWARPEPEGGATFGFVLPRAAEEPDAPI